AFVADIPKGYVIKVMVEVFYSSSTPRLQFVISDEGILIRQTDDGDTLLFNIELPRDNFLDYVYKLKNKQKIISVNLIHLHDLIKNNKKKDSLTLFIEDDSTQQIGIIIKPDQNKRVRKQVN